jgi:CheY-like chemotaxis protein
VRQSQLMNTLATVWSKNLVEEPPVPSVSRDGFEQRRASFAERTGGRPIRVLIAEDNPVNQKVAATILEKIGAHADVAANGREAFDMSGSVRYDLILMDCQMPELDGYDAARAIRQREGGGPRVPIVAMTADAMAGSRERCLAAGMDDYIVKPVRMEEVFDTLMRWIPPAGPSASSSRPDPVAPVKV